MRKTSGFRGRPKGVRCKPLPEKSNTLAWARILAAARGADKLQADKTNAAPMSKARKVALLPVARQLYDENVRQRADGVWRQLQLFLARCQQVLKKVGRPLSEVRSTFVFDAAKQWDEDKCSEEAKDLTIRQSLHSVLAASPNLIGLHMIPLTPGWRFLRYELISKLPRDERRFKMRFSMLFNKSIHNGHLDKNTMQPLIGERFVDTVLKWASPLVRALPAQWTSPDITDELLEALLALVRLPRTRPLDMLVGVLSDADYNWLESEHWCLSQAFIGGSWSQSCDSGRSLVEYLAFARALKNDAGFKGLVARVPAKPSLAVEPRGPVDPSDLSWGGTAQRRRVGWLMQQRTTPLELPSIFGEPEPRDPRPKVHPGLGAESLVPAQPVESALRGTSRLSASGRSGSFAFANMFNDLDGPLPGVGLSGDDEALEQFQLHNPTDLVGMGAQEDMRLLTPLLWEVEAGVGEPSRFSMDAWEKPSFEVGQPSKADSSSLPGQPASRAHGHLARSGSATAVSGVSVVPLAVAGAVASLGVVLLLLILVFRARRAVTFRTRSSSATGNH